MVQHFIETTESLLCVEKLVLDEIVFRQTIYEGITINMIRLHLELTTTK